MQKRVKEFIEKAVILILTFVIAFIEKAKIFIVAFVIFLTVTLACAELPPGKAISNTVGINPNVTIRIVWHGTYWGDTVLPLTSAILNGVIYGIITW